MKSGSPAFGTPEHIKLSIGSGQLARFIDLPWRSAAGSASNTADMQSGTENNMGLWAALQANATLTVDEDSFGWSALQDVEPGGHFFATEHTMQRYRDAFYSPLVADLSNHGSWTEAGGLSSSERATQIWKRILDEFAPPPHSAATMDNIATYIEEGISRGGAKPSEG